MTNSPTNVSNSQWQIISNFLDVERNRKYELQEIIMPFYNLVKTGCQWRMLPADFPKTGFFQPERFFRNENKR